jgi:hypothetical protein
MEQRINKSTIKRMLTRETARIVGVSARHTRMVTNGDRNNDDVIEVKMTLWERVSAAITETENEYKERIAKREGTKKRYKQALKS